METHLEEEIFREIFTQLNEFGKEVIVRGLKTREILNFSCVFPPYIRFPNFLDRKLNLNYIRQELKWYFKGSPADLSICNHAKLWKTLINESNEFEGTILSNYGAYIFGEMNQFDRVIEILKHDPQSRRASIMILQPKHILCKTAKEIPCTKSLSFQIRDNKLIMSVVMRSQDAIFGGGNDWPFFSIIQEMVFQTLRETYPNLQMGDYHHFVESFHIYEQHYNMLEKLVTTSEFIPVLCPKISSKSEVTFLRNLHIGQVDQVPDDFHFTKWLLM